jgi:uncharacterized membrane protein
MSTDTDWQIGQVLKTAMEKQVGFKWSYMAPFLIYLIITSVIAVLQDATVGTGEGVAASLTQVIVNILVYPLGIGLGLLGIRRAAGKDTPLSTLWEPYSQFIPLVVMLVLMGLLIVGGFFLLVLPGIYLAVAYSFAPYLMIEKNMGVWEALETSRKAITTCWWRYFGLLLIAVLLFIVGTIPLLIGLVWVLPIMAIAIGEVFKTTLAEGFSTDAD